MQDKKIREAIERLRPKEGSGIDSVTLSAGGKSVTLHKKEKEETMLVEGKGIKINGIGKLGLKTDIKEEKEGGVSVDYSMSLTIDLSAEEKAYIEKMANLQTKWSLELYPTSYNLPLQQPK